MSSSRPVSIRCCPVRARLRPSAQRLPAAPACATLRADTQAAMPFATVPTDRTVVRLVEAGVEDDYWRPTGIVHALQQGESRTVLRTSRRRDAPVRRPGLPAGRDRDLSVLQSPLRRGRRLALSRLSTALVDNGRCQAHACGVQLTSHRPARVAVDCRRHASALLRHLLLRVLTAPPQPLLAGSGSVASRAPEGLRSHDTSRSTRPGRVDHTRSQHCRGRDSVAARRSLNSTDRFYARLHSDSLVDVWLLTWLHDQSTDLHDHGLSAAAFTVVRGELLEVRATADARLISHRRLPGETTWVALGVVHDVRHSSGPAISIHGTPRRSTR